MFNQIGPLEIIIVLVIVLVIFGPKRLPGLGKSLGSGMREFKDSITGEDKDSGDKDEAAAEQATLARAEDPVAPPQPAAAEPARESEPATAAEQSPRS
jgi:sec-independent protein translocase protein TatA